jgi:serine/threonine protein kinase
MIRTLGTGTFGRVKLTRHIVTGQTFAMKILQKAQVVAFQQQQNVMTEKKIMAAAKHPFILELVATFKVIYQHLERDALNNLNAKPRTKIVYTCYWKLCKVVNCLLTCKIVRSALRQQR